MFKKRYIAFLSLLGLVTGFAFGQTTGLTTITATNINSGGTKIANGVVTITPVNSIGIPIAINDSAGGLYGPAPVSCTITAGAIAASCTVPDLAFVTPSDARYRFQVLNSANGASFAFQNVTSVSGATWALDTYQPSASSPAQQFTAFYGTGAPPARCSTPSFYTLTTGTGTLYECVNGTYQAVGGAGAGSIGPAGKDGVSPTVAVGTTSTLAPGVAATVTDSGNGTAHVFNFGIPQGAAGASGSGSGSGTSATVAVGTTTTGAAGSAASVTNSGSNSAAVFNFTVPAGVNGTNGTNGTPGTNGTNGAAGVSPTITVVSNVGAAGSNPSVVDSATGSAHTFTFTLPQAASGSGSSTSSIPAFTGIPYNNNGTLQLATPAQVQAAIQDTSTNSLVGFYTAASGSDTGISNLSTSASWLLSKLNDIYVQPFGQTTQIPLLYTIAKINTAMLATTANPVAHCVWSPIDNACIAQTSGSGSSASPATASAPGTVQLATGQTSSTLSTVATTGASTDLGDTATLARLATADLFTAAQQFGNGNAPCSAPILAFGGTNTGLVKGVSGVTICFGGVPIGVFQGPQFIFGSAQTSAIGGTAGSVYANVASGTQGSGAFIASSHPIPVMLTAVSAAATIAPTSAIFHLGGSGTVTTITPTIGMSAAGCTTAPCNGGNLTIIFDTTTAVLGTGGNINSAFSPAAAGAKLFLTWDPTHSLYY